MHTFIELPGFTRFAADYFARENIAVSTLNLLREMAEHAEID